MECFMNIIASSSIYPSPKISLSNNQLHNSNDSRFLSTKIASNDVVFRVKTRSVSCAAGNLRKLTSLESKFCYDKSIPEEIIEKPVGLELADKVIGDNPPCPTCETKGALLCKTCSGSGLYVESILESQGIIVKVRCLGCGGTGNTMCEECGGRGHV